MGHVSGHVLNDNTEISSADSLFFNPDFLFLLEVLKSEKHETPDDNKSHSNVALDEIEGPIFLCIIGHFGGE